MSELKPCPFCGGEPFVSEREHDEYWYKVECKRCGRYKDNKQHAIAQWNRRADGWIPVSERLPQVGEPVLVWLCLKKYIDIRIFWGSGAESIWRERYTHWRPLPAPPEGE